MRVWRDGPRGRPGTPVQKGHGIAMGDINNDGWLDMYANQGGWLFWAGSPKVVTVVLLVSSCHVSSPRLHEISSTLLVSH